MLSRAFNADRRSNFSALDILNTTLLFVNKDERTTWKKLVSHGLEISSQLHHYRLFQKLLGEYEGIFNLSSMYLDAGSYCMKLRNAKAALMYYAQAESIFHKFLDEEHPDLLICKEQRENVIGMDGQKIDLLVEKNV